MIFNQISPVMSRVTQMTAGCVIKKHLASQKVESGGATSIIISFHGIYSIM